MNSSTYIHHSNQELDIIINNKLQGLQDNDFVGTVEVMALIDTRYHSTDSIIEFNQRLRQSVKNNFNKSLLTPSQDEIFREWEYKLETLSRTLSRFDFFASAPPFALDIIGI